jgi:transcription elongation factor GreA-like protein
MIKENLMKLVQSLCCGKHSELKRSTVGLYIKGIAFFVFHATEDAKESMVIVLFVLFCRHYREAKIKLAVQLLVVVER